MSSEGNLGALPTDLLLQILSRLPSKSVARCRCVSKLWASLLTIGSPYFTELFLTQSKTRPRLLFTVQKNNYEWCLYSCTQPQISSTNSKSSISVTAGFHMSLPNSSRFVHISPSVSGLMYFYNMPDLNNPTLCNPSTGHLNNPTLCNPSTGHLFSLPQLTKTRQSYFGYDPINKQFNVLAISHPRLFYQDEPPSYKILKLGSGKLYWRSLKCPLQHYPFELNICINGILYYKACVVSNPFHKIVCFDLNSEEFKLIDQPWSYDEPMDLVNFKGKLCGISRWVMFGSDERFKLELTLWILEDFENQEWSKHLHHLPLELCNKKYEDTHVCVVGASVTGDIVLSSSNMSNPFYVYFFNPEKNTFQEVEVKGFEDCKSNTVYSFVDYVEDLRTF